MPARDKVLIAIDPSLSATGIAIFRGGRLFKTAVLKPSGQDRLSNLAQEFDAILQMTNPHAFAIETQYLSSFGGNSMIKVIEVKGLLEGVYYAHCTRHNQPPVLFQVQPSEAKKYVGVIGRHKRKDSKELVAKMVCAMYPNLAKERSQDIFDAVAIGSYAWQQYATMQLAQYLSTN